MKTPYKYFLPALGLPVSLLHSPLLLAQIEPHASSITEIVVTAPFAQTAGQTTQPSYVLSNEILSERVSNSLGDTIKGIIGVQSASFGTGVGQPIIRGQTGRRVQVLQSGNRQTDAAGLSPDHANAIEPVLAERIEVLRGPSTLLYGNGAIGGVVNVIDGRIPETLADRPEFLIQQSYNSVNDENKTVAKFEASLGSIGLHLDGFTRENNNVDINGFAIDEEALEALEALHGHTDPDDHDDEPENTNGFIGNSNSESQGGTIGFSYVGDAGFLGFSVNQLDNEYGLPSGAHAHHEHDDGGAPDPDHDDEEGAEVRIVMEQTRFDVRGMQEFSGSFIESMRAALSYTDYMHEEVEVADDGDTALGTRYTNKGLEGRLTFNHAPVGDLSGVWGLQFADTEYSATGEESFIPRSDIRSTGIFGIERLTLGEWQAELGLRIEDSSIDPDAICGSSDTSTSISGNLLYNLDAESNILFGYNRSQRAPTVEELYSNVDADTCARYADDEDLVLHAATSLLEVGNPNLNRETSNNIELGFRKHLGEITGEINVYYNQIDDYIFLNLTGDEHEEQEIANYLARDARFTGLEAEVTMPLFQSNVYGLNLRLFGDLVNAEFDSGGNVPRTPPARLGAELRYFGTDWTFNLSATGVMEQDDVGEDELSTDGYTLLSIYTDYHWSVGNNSELLVYLRGDNLLDEEVRNHTSFLKNYAPEPGQAFSVGIRFEY